MKKLRIPESLTSMAFRHIRTYLLNGELAEGERLTEESVAQRLGISKSPVREAFNRLEADGLIRIEPRRGVYLRTFSVKEIEDLYDFREALEVHAVRHARITPELIADLQENLARHAEYHAARDRSNYIAVDIQFHAAIAAATGNAMLGQALERLQDQLSILRRKTFDLSSSKAVAAHQAITTALAAGDREAAAAVMQRHIRETCVQLTSFIASAGAARQSAG